MADFAVGDRVSFTSTHKSGKVTTHVGTIKVLTKHITVIQDDNEKSAMTSSVALGNLTKVEP